MRILVFGGDTRVDRRFDFPGYEVLTCPSTKFGGGRTAARLVERLQSTDLVVLLTKWLGHSEVELVVGHCRVIGARFIYHRGGFASARNLIDAELEKA